MMKRGTLAVTLAAAFAISSGAQAATINDLLFTGAQLGSDSSAEVLINAAGTGATTLDVGDRLLGIVEIEKLQQGAQTRPIGLGTVNDELTGIFDIVVTSVTTSACTITPGTCPTGTQWNFTFAAVPSATFTADTGIVAPAGTTIATFDDPSPDFNRGGTVATGIASAVDGTPYWYLGLVGPNTTWTATAGSNDITVIGALPQGISGGSFNFSLNQLAGGIGPTLGLTQCTLGLVNACGNGSLTARDPASGFQSFDQTQIAINVVPEPATAALVGGVLLALGFARRRRTP